MLIEQAVDVARTGIRQQAGRRQRVIEALINLRGQPVVTVQAPAHLTELHFHDGAHGGLAERPVNHRLEAGQQRRLEVVTQQRAQPFMQVGFGGLRLFLQQLHDVVAAEVRGHQDNGVAEVDFPAFTVAHKAPVKDLVEQVHHITMRLLHFIEQDHAVRAFSDGFSEDAALAVTDIPRWGALQLGYGVRLLVLGEVDGNQGFLAAKQFVRQGQRRFGLAGAARPGQQEHALRTVLRRQPGF